MSSLPIPAELNQPLPRHVKSTGWFQVLVTVLTVFIPCPGLALLGFTFLISHEKAVLKANGVPFMAEVTDFRTGRGKGGVYYQVSYRFPASSASGGRPYVQSSFGVVSEDRFRELHVGQAVPILYDPARPNNSSLNFDDSVHRSDPYEEMALMMAGIVGLFGGLYALLMAFLLFSYFREKKLLQWGHVAPAVILEEDEIGGRYPSMTATFQFTDEQGRTVTGLQKELPSTKRGFREFREAVTKNPIALYDPDNSEKNMLYRAGFLVCCLP